jgi:hypothetical protein
VVIHAQDFLDYLLFSRGSVFFTMAMLSNSGFLKFFSLKLLTCQIIVDDFSNCLNLCGKQ